MWRLEAVDEDSPGALRDAARTLMVEYATLPHTVGRWRTVSADLEALPRPFVSPTGVLLVIFDGAAAIGCGALRILEPGVGEVKRMYIRPSARGRGAGEALLQALIDRAEAMGLGHVRLDTAPELVAAQALYRRFGFTPIPRYLESQLPDALCYERAVARDTPPD